MDEHDLLQDFQRLTANLDDPAPCVHVVPQVMCRIRQVRTVVETTWTFLAAGSCVAAVVVAIVGFSLLSPATDSMEAILEIVPPIALQ